MAIRHPGGPTEPELLTVGADRDRLAEWLGDHDLPVVASGPFGASTITLTQGERDITLE